MRAARLERYLHDVGGLGRIVGGVRHCHFADDQMSFLRDETKKHGFATSDGVHMGPCEIHRKHAYTIGPDGDLYACPGFTGERSLSTGHIDGMQRRAPVRCGAQVRPAGRVEGVRRLRLHPGVRGRLHGRVTHRARRHERAQLPQESFEAGVASMARDAAASLTALANQGRFKETR